MTMGILGIHYERTRHGGSSQSPGMTILRCQFMARGLLPQICYSASNRQKNFITTKKGLISMNAAPKLLAHVCLLKTRCSS